MAALSCHELVGVVTDYLEGGLPDAERRRFESHLAACPHCTRYLEQFRLTIAATGTLSEDVIEPAAKEDLLRVFRDWKASAAPETV